MKYLNSFEIYDINTEPLKMNSAIRVRVQPTVVVLEKEKQTAERYGRICLILYAASMLLWTVQALYTKATKMPLLIFTWYYQSMFFMMAPFFNFTPQIKHFFSFFRVFTFEFLWLDHVFIKMGLINHKVDLISGVFSTNMSGILQYKFANLMVNNSSKIIIWLIFAVIFITASYFNFMILNCTRWKVSLFHQVKNTFLFNVPVVFVTLCMLPMSCSMMLEFRLRETNNNIQTNSFFLCLLLLLFWFYLMGAMTAVILAYSGKYNVKMLLLKYTPLVAPLKNNLPSKMFLPLFMFKNFAYGCLYAVLQFYSVGILGFLAFTEICVSLLLL